MANQRMINVDVVDQCSFDDGPLVFNGKLFEVIGAFLKVQESIPEEHRSTAYCVISSNSDGECSINISYSRPETDEDIAERRRQRAAWELAREREARAKYEELKRKFERGA